ncbi:MAG: glycosyltransferase family 2 protein [Cyclobacteriaceae bacterium]|nr:glycosyltransferase family 2 protein [Cyclobacteriaceae bacterium]
MNYPLVSIITVNYNSLDVTLEFLDSIFKIEYPTIEVIVIDNASNENPQNTILKNYPQVRFFRTSSNLGFAGGNNVGVRAAQGKYIMFLNNDTEVSSQFLHPLVELLEHDPNIGICSPLILYYYTDHLIQYAGSTKVNPFTGRNKRPYFMQRDNNQFGHAFETSLAHGAAMMVPKHIIQQVGEMPEIFFLYYEELDWCEAIKRAGYKIYVEPRSKVYHKESVSVGKMSTFKTYYLNRSRLLYMRRNTFGLNKILWVIFFTLISFPKNSLLYLVRGQFDHLKAFADAVLWNLSHKKNGERLINAD